MIQNLFDWMGEHLADWFLEIVEAVIDFLENIIVDQNYA